jgi:hypothetical protein
MSENKQLGSSKHSDKKQSEDSMPVVKNRVPEPWESQPCPLCRKVKSTKRCPGHAAGGGSSGGGDSEEKAGNVDGKVLASTPGQIDAGSQVANATTQVVGSRELTLKLDEITFNPEIISELLSNKLLVIDNDSVHGILTIKLQCDPRLLSEEKRKELKKFVNAILKELDEFKKENRIQGECKTIEQDGDGNTLLLRITSLKPDQYDAFIRRLARKNLLPTQNIKQQPEEKVVYQAGINHFNPTPFSTKPTPYANRNVKSKIDENISQEEKKSSSIRPKSLLDGLKPEGWK